MANLYPSKAIIDILLRHGFIFISQKDSHNKFRKGERTVIVPDPKKETPLGTFASILRQSGLSKNDFK